MKLKQLFSLFTSMSPGEQYNFIEDYRTQRVIDIQTALENKTKKRKKATKAEQRIANLTDTDKTKLEEMLALCPDMKNFI